MADRLSLYDRLVDLLKPYVEPLVKLRLREEERNIPLRWRLYIRVTLFFIILYMKCQWIKEWIKNKKFRKEHPPFFLVKTPKSQVDKECDDFEIRKTVGTIVCFWMQALVLTAEDRRKLILANLDEAMLPINHPPIFKDKNIAQLLDEQCATLVISAQDVRNILRAVRHSLPTGQVLPEAMIDYLKSAGVTVE